MSGHVANFWHHHSKFFISLAIGVAAWGIASFIGLKMPLAIAGDIFFLSLILAFAWSFGHVDAHHLKQRAKIEDEGAFLVSLIILAAVAYTCVAIFTALNDKHSIGPGWLAVLLAGAPLGWAVIHLNEAAHYSNLYYGSAHRKSWKPPLDFHGDDEPGAWEFLYFSFVIGMTMQTSDTDILTTPMRRAVVLHGIVSFFFDTILIAMAVNAVVSHA